MALDFNNPGTVDIKMDGYMREWMQTADVIGHATSPASLDLFSIDEHSKPATKEQSKYFHSQVAKALYAAKRTRPDLLTAVSFLSKRTLAPTEQDMDKLKRLLRYVKSTIDLPMTLGMSDKPRVTAYVDASYAIHKDMKSHSGVAVTLGQGFFYCKSTTQKLNTKSSTEAELVALSDHYGMGIWSRELLTSLGFKVLPTVVAQDNMSTITLATKGRSTADSTRHISIRYFFIKNRIEEGEIILEYVPTKDMVADILTKPLQGNQFRQLRAILLGQLVPPFPLKKE
jgi:hypothetical protein